MPFPPRLSSFSCRYRRYPSVGRPIGEALAEPKSAARTVSFESRAHGCRRTFGLTGDWKRAALVAMYRQLRCPSNRSGCASGSSHGPA